MIKFNISLSIFFSGYIILGIQSQSTTEHWACHVWRTNFLGQVKWNVFKTIFSFTKIDLFKLFIFNRSNSVNYIVLFYFKKHIFLNILRILLFLLYFTSIIISSSPILYLCAYLIFFSIKLQSGLYVIIYIKKKTLLISS